MRAGTVDKGVCMIVVTKYEDRITVKGHANYAEPGSDIVCAGVSTLVQTLEASLERLTDGTCTVSAREPGDFRLIFGDEQTLEEQVLLDAFMIGIKGIAAAYPCYVSLKYVFKCWE